MKLYIDCTNGITGALLLRAFEDLGAELDEIKDYKLPDMGHTHGEHGGHDHAHDGHDHTHEAHGEHEHHGEHDHHHDDGGAHGHHHEHSHGRTLEDVKRIIGSLPAEYEAKKTALAIYKEIAEAEASVHGAEPDTVHFHEVGRDEAIKNALCVGEALRQFAVSEVYCSEVHNGNGKVECAHGLLDVPVPAVRAMMENCDYSFVTEDGEGELTTPSGLAMLIGMGAKSIPSMADFSHELLAAGIEKKGEGKPLNPTGRPGLRLYLTK